MPVAFVTRRLHFSAGHRLHNPALSDAQNRDLYGPCSNPGGHGHNYMLDVTVRGDVDSRTGFVIDLKRLKELVEATVLRDLDHANLNTEVPWLRGVIPTAENIAIGVWRQLEKHLPAGSLHRVVVWETDRNCVEYRGE